MIKDRKREEKGRGEMKREAERGLQRKREEDRGGERKSKEDCGLERKKNQGRSRKISIDQDRWPRETSETKKK